MILLASKADITERFSNHEPVDDFVEKPFFLKEATQRIKRLIDKIALEKMAKTAPSDGVVRGSLAQMNVIDLVQSLEMSRKSCALTLTLDRDKCEMYFKEGQVTHAVYGALTGDPAVFKVLGWTGGNFQINFEGKTSKQTTTLNTQGLLMEGLRMLDESKRDDGGPAEQEEEDEDVLLDLEAPVSQNCGCSYRKRFRFTPWGTLRRFRSGRRGASDQARFYRDRN